MKLDDLLSPSPVLPSTNFYGLMDNWVGSWYWKLQLIEGRFGYALRWAILGPNASRRQQQVNDLQIQLFIQQLNFSLAVRASGEKRLRQFLHNNKKKTFIIPLLLDEKRNQKKKWPYVRHNLHLGAHWTKKKHEKQIRRCLFVLRLKKISFNANKHSALLHLIEDLVGLNKTFIHVRKLL